MKEKERERTQYRERTPIKLNPIFFEMVEIIVEPIEKICYCLFVVQSNLEKYDQE